MKSADKRLTIVTMNSRRSLSNRIYILFAYLFSFFCILQIDMPTGFDYILYFIFGFLFFLFSKRKKTLPKSYLLLMTIGILTLLLNSIITKYHVPYYFVFLGLFITYLPFFHFALSYNYDFTLGEVKSYMKWLTNAVIIISCVIIVENILFIGEIGGEGFINSKIFGLGFYASTCNQIIILSIGRYIYSKKRSYICIALLLLFFILLTVQIKAIVGSMVVIVGYIFMFTKSKIIKFVFPAILLSLIIVITLSTPKLLEKVTKYQELYLSEDAVNGVARSALYFTSFQIAYDFFPFGTGQGTFGSVPSKMLPDDVYCNYGINKMYGLNGEDPDFRLDTHWAYIFGENGVLGLVIYLSLFFYPIRRVRKIDVNVPELKMYKFIVNMSIITIFVESFALPLPNRLSLIFIYSGLSGIILSRLKSLKIL